MIPELRGPRITCPHCGGTGETTADARIMRYGLLRWVEIGCTCCQARGWTTKAWLAIWKANREVRRAA